jgi:hypothetical protein
VRYIGNDRGRKLSTVAGTARRIAEGRVGFRRAGTKNAHLTVTPRGLALVRSRRRIRVRVSAVGYPFNTRRAAVVALLHD